MDYDKEGASDIYTFVPSDLGERHTHCIKPTAFA
jgi:hypothetical protein